MADEDLPTQSPVLDRLHTYLCEETDHDFHRMKKILKRDSSSLNRPTVVCIFDNGVEHCLTPLLIAIECKHLKCVQFLLDAGANMKPRGTNGRDAMTYAIFSEFYEVIDLLLKKGFRLDYTHYEYGPLDRTRYIHNAASQSTPEMVQYLLDHGAVTEDLEFIHHTSEMCNLTPAVTAISNERPDTLKVLLLNGAILDPMHSNLLLTDEKNDSLLLSLHLVISFGDNLEQKIKIMNVLFHFGADFLQDTKMGPNPLTILENDHLRVEAREFIIFNDISSFMPDFSLPNRQILATKMRTLTSFPMSLKGKCRLAIKKHMGQRFFRDARKLTDLPRELIDFLYFKYF